VLHKKAESLVFCRIVKSQLLPSGRMITIIKFGVEMLPPWNLAGVLPPLLPGEDGTSPHRSPYQVSLADVVQRFSTTPERILILRGLLAFRAQLHALGLVDGFQWLDGSFMEHVELIEGRSPQDIDAVTYFRIPGTETEGSIVAKAPQLFDHDDVKANYSVDHYPVVLGKEMTAAGVREVSYWYSMWSHRRDDLWKGFVQIDLNPQQDVDAIAFLPSVSGGAP
jgi:hypothetical protein